LAEKAVFLFLVRQSCELGVQGVVREEEGLLAVKDRRVVTRGIVVTLQSPGPKGELDAAQERGVSVGVEIGGDPVTVPGPPRGGPAGQRATGTRPVVRKGANRGWGGALPSGRKLHRRKGAGSSYFVKRIHHLRVRLPPASAVAKR